MTLYNRAIAQKIPGPKSLGNYEVCKHHYFSSIGAILVGSSDLGLG